MTPVPTQATRVVSGETGRPETFAAVPDDDMAAAAAVAVESWRRGLRRAMDREMWASIWIWGRTTA
jgi:hypothetical protein